MWGQYLMLYGILLFKTSLWATLELGEPQHPLDTSMYLNLWPVHIGFPLHHDAEPCFTICTKWSENSGPARYNLHIAN